MENILVTGCCGFLGSSVTEILLENGYGVIGVDNKSKYIDNERAFFGSPHFYFIEDDIQNALPGNLDEISDVSYIVPCAGRHGGAGFYHAYAYDAAWYNQRLFDATLQFAIHRHRFGLLRGVVHMSSDSVYEGADDFPCEEADVDWIRPPYSPWGFEHLCEERQLRAAFEQYGLPYICLRISSPTGRDYGIRGKIPKKGELHLRDKMGANHALVDIAIRVLLSEKTDALSLLGEGEQIRQFTSARDIATAVLNTIKVDLFDQEEFNIAYAETVAVRDVASAMFEETHGVTPQISEVMPYFYDIPVKAVSTSKAQQRIHFLAKDTPAEIGSDILRWVDSEI